MSSSLKFKKNDIWILLDHPLKVEKNNNVIFNNGDYVLIFIQKLSQLNESSGKLRGSGYYEGWDENYLNRLLQR